MKLLDLLKEINIKANVGKTGRGPDSEARLKIAQYIANGSEGDLRLHRTNIRTLGPLEQVNGYAVLHSCEYLTSLGDLTYVRGNLSLDNCTRLQSLGKVTHVGGALDISGTGITSLGNLEYCARLSIDYNQLKSDLLVPESLQGDTTVQTGAYVAYPYPFLKSLYDSGIDLSQQLHTPVVKLPLTLDEDIVGVVDRYSKPVFGYSGKYSLYQTTLRVLSELIRQSSVNPNVNFIVTKKDKLDQKGFQLVCSIMFTLPGVPGMLVYDLENSVFYNGKKYSVQSIRRKIDSGQIGQVSDLFKSKSQSKTTKVVKLSALVDKTREPVSFTAGRFKRFGLGLSGDFKTYEASFSTPTWNNLFGYTQRLGIQWKDFIAYRDRGNGDVNFIINGETSDGEKYYYYRGGTGQGGFSKLVKVT